MPLPLQSALKRPAAPSNTIARGNALPASPAYGNTTNVTGAQTAQAADSSLPPSAPGTMPSTVHGMPFTTMANAGMALAGSLVNPFIQADRQQGAEYPGGDAPGIAAYYRNSALNNYQGGQKTMDARNANAPAAIQPETAQQTLSRIQSTNQQRLQAQEAARQQNTRGFTSVLDPNRLRPEQTQQIAETSARQFGENDPTGLRGRMAGFGAGPGDTWYDRYEQAQLNQERSDRAARAEARYNSPEKVQERAARSALKATPEYQQKIKDAKIKRDAAAQGYRDEHGGLSRRQVRRLEQIRRINQQQVRAGRISQEEADARMGYRADEFKAQAAAGQANKSALNATSLDRVRLPDGQLPAATREKAATTAKNLTDPNYKAPTPQFRKEQEIVQSLGLTHEMSAPEATAIINATPIPQEPAERKQFVSALRKYWGSMRDANSEWSQAGGPQADSLNRLAELPESEWDKWLTQDWPKTQSSIRGFQVPGSNIPGLGGAPFGR